MTDRTYWKFVRRWEEVTDIPPQTMGPLTALYKTVTRRLKTMPWFWYVGMSAAVALVLFGLLGQGIARLVTILQAGF